MRLLVYYNFKKDCFVCNWKEDRFVKKDLFTYDHYGHYIIDYLYVLDNQFFLSYKTYLKYLKKRAKKYKKPLKYRLGNKLLNLSHKINDLGRYLMYGRKERVVYVYKNRNQWWRY